MITESTLYKLGVGATKLTLSSPINDSYSVTYNGEVYVISKQGHHALGVFYHSDIVSIDITNKATS